MTTNQFLVLACSLLLLSGCTDGISGKADSLLPQIQKLTQLRTEAEAKDDLEGFMAFYSENAISMPEYQPLLTGTVPIQTYYAEIFRRQNIKSFRRTTEEIIDLDSAIVEFGTLTKEYINADSGSDSVLTLNGKYYHVWAAQPNGSLKLKGEAFGYFHHVPAAETFVVDGAETDPTKADSFTGRPGPFELRAYNALNEKLVKTRDGAARSEFYTADAKFMPFAEPTVSGSEIKPYLIEYSSRGWVVLDSVAVYTYHAENYGDYILEYAMFKVKWHREETSGRTEGKGLRVWKRQPDQSLKMYRQIGTHNHLN